MFRYVFIHRLQRLRGSCFDRFFNHQRHTNVARGPSLPTWICHCNRTQQPYVRHLDLHFHRNTYRQPRNYPIAKLVHQQQWCTSGFLLPLYIPRKFIHLLTEITGDLLTIQLLVSNFDSDQSHGVNVSFLALRPLVDKNSSNLARSFLSNEMAGHGAELSTLKLFDTIGLVHTH